MLIEYVYFSITINEMCIVWQVKLTDSLMSGLAWRSAGDAELAWLSAVVTPRAHQRESDATTGMFLLEIF